MSNCPATKDVEFDTGVETIECCLEDGHDGRHEDVVSELWWRS